MAVGLNAASVNREQKRQEVIFELLYTEEDYVHDLHVIRRVFKEPLEGSYAHALAGMGSERERIIKELFGPLDQLIAGNEQMLESLKVNLCSPSLFFIILDKRI